MAGKCAICCFKKELDSFTGIVIKVYTYCRPIFTPDICGVLLSWRKEKTWKYISKWNKSKGGAIEYRIICYIGYLNF